MKKKQTNYAPHLFLGCFLFALAVSYPGCMSSEEPKESPLMKQAYVGKRECRGWWEFKSIS